MQKTQDWTEQYTSFMRVVVFINDNPAKAFPLC